MLIRKQVNMNKKQRRCMIIQRWRKEEYEL